MADAGRATQGKGQSATGTAGPSSPLGERLRQERDHLGLSLRELARRLEVSPSLVSQIETGKIQPSVRTLYAMVSELGVSLDDVFAPPRRPGAGRPGSETQHADAAAISDEAATSPGNSRVQRAHDRHVIELQSGVRWERLTTGHDRQVEFLYTIYEVGGASSAEDELVRHNGREFGVVISGQLGVTVGFEEYLLGPGDSISFESSTPHRLHNDGEEVVHAIWVVIGCYQQ